MQRQWGASYGGWCAQEGWEARSPWALLELHFTQLLFCSQGTSATW